MAAAKDGDKVKVNYTGRLDDESVFDSSDGGEPLEFTIGAGNVIVGFENAAIGLKPGDKRTVTIPVDKAYGPYKEELILKVDKSELPEKIEPKVGQRYHVPIHTGGIAIVIVTDIGETDVTLDGNHPLAGKDLTFDVELVEIV